MQLIEAFVQNPVKVAVGVLLATLFGVIALLRMPMQLTPEVQTPTITIQTRWPGASPQEVEQEIVIEQEEQLKSVEGIKKLSSESADSFGTITLEFQVGTKMDEALLKVNSRLQQVRDYPDDADRPVLSTSNASDRPIAWFILSSRTPNEADLDEFAGRHPQLRDKLTPVRRAPNVGVAMLRLRLLANESPEFQELLPPPGTDVSKLRRFAEDEIEARFERVPGVSQSNVMGGLEEELQVIVDPEMLAARQLTMSDMRQVLRSQNEDTSAGDFWEGKRRWVVRALGQFRSPEQVANQLLAVRDGMPVYVRDVAEVNVGYKKPDGLVRRFGETCLAVNCLRETGANVLEVMAGLQQAAGELDHTLLASQGLQLTQVYDETQYIKSSVDLVRQNIFVGGALTIIVLMVFLHLGRRTMLTIPVIVITALASAYLSPWFFVLTLLTLLVTGFWFARGALVVSLAIPTSIVGTFLVLKLLNRSLNVISLAGMAFAVGMLVDNAVVVLENIYRRHALGERPFAAAVNGTKEVWGAVVASTLTTIAVFLPVIFVQEEAGQLFQDIALAISAAVGLSLLVSVTVIPTAAARLLQRQATDGDATEPPVSRSRGPSRVSARSIAWIEDLASRFVRGVVESNQWIQAGLYRRLGVTAALVGVSMSLSWILFPRVEYLPTGNRNLVFGILMPPPGYNLDQLMAMGEIVEAGLRPYWDVDADDPATQKLDFPAIDDFFFVARGRSVFMGLRAYDASRAGELVPLVQKVAGQLPGTFAVAKQSSLFEQGLTAGRTIDIEITGPDLRRLVAIGGQIMGTLNAFAPDPAKPEVRVPLIQGAQARPVPSLDLSTPEIHVRPKLLQAAEMGVSSSELGFTTNALIDGAYVCDYFLNGKKVDLRVLGRGDYARRTQDVERLSIATPIGRLIPLGALAEVTLSSGPEQVNHRERVRAITIEVSPPPEVSLEESLARIDRQIIQPLLSSGQIEEGYRLTMSGTADKLRDTWMALRFNVILALLITYLLMAALFESWLYPLVIILTVPLGAVGGVLGLRLLNLFVLQPLDVLTMLGFVILIGTVVNNPILIVHQSLSHIREDGMDPTAAILESVRTRIRPIFMTTITTVLGLLPLVLFPGAGSELYRGLGSVVLGGLLISTLFTLILVPTLFSLTLQAKQAIWQLLDRVLRGSAGPATEAALPYGPLDTSPIVTSVLVPDGSDES